MVRDIAPSGRDLCPRLATVGDKRNTVAKVGLGVGPRAATAGTHEGSDAELETDR